MRKTYDERPSDFERTSLFADAIFAMPSTPKLPDGLLNPTFIFDADRRARRALFQSATRRQAFRRHDTPRRAKHFLKEPDFTSPLRGGVSPKLGGGIQSRLLLSSEVLIKSNEIIRGRARIR